MFLKMKFEIKFCFISIAFASFVFNWSGCLAQQTVKPDYADKLQNWLESQKQLDCQQFDADLIECFAYNLFLKNSALFSDLDQENILMKPILTKHFENKTVQQGQNVTLTCETQIDALPIFLFYKLNQTILTEYNRNKNSNSILSKHSHPIQMRSDSAMNDYQSSDPNHIRLERRIHSSDSNKDNLAELETINLHVLNTIQSDSGYYLCIVANSMKSFRVTYSYLDVMAPKPITTTITYDYVDILTESSRFWSLGNNHIVIGLIIAIILFIIFIIMFVCYCCMQFSQQSSQKFHNPELVITNTIKETTQQPDSTLNNEKKMNSLIEKTMNSMKNNFIYVPMSDDCNEVHRTACTSPVFRNSTELDANDLEFSREKLKLGRLIDEGSFGRVYLADAFGIINGRYKTTVTVKMLKENATKYDFETFIKEMETMRSIGKHENIINLLGCCTTQSGPVYAIVEHAKYGTLRSYLRAHRPKDYNAGLDHNDSCQSQDELSFDENEADLEDKTAFKSILKLQKQLNTFKTNNNLYSTQKLNSSIHSPCLSFTSSTTKTAVTSNQASLMLDLVRFCTQVSNGMKFLHSKNVSHRDLAARNILLNEFKVAKIADIGLARDLILKSPVSIKWMSPETLFDGRSYHNSDQWSFGVLMWEIFSLGDNPYPLVPVETLFDYLKEGNRISKPMYCDDELYELMLDCWNFKSEMRPSFININDRLNHILDKYERKKIEQMNYNNTPIKSLMHETPTRLNMLKINSPTSKKIISSRQSESEDSQYFSGTDTSLVYADSSGHSSSSSCNFSTMSPVSYYSNNYAALPSNNAAAVRAATLMTVSLNQAPPSPPPLKPLSRLLNVASAAYDL